MNVLISLCNSDEGNTDVVTCALADASGTSYVRGRWISDSENSLESHHRIVAPTLPGSGDYSAYSLWGKLSKKKTLIKLDYYICLFKNVYFQLLQIEMVCQKQIKKIQCTIQLII